MFMLMPSEICLYIDMTNLFRNVMITGPASCGKSFMLKPLEIIYGDLLEIYNAFSNQVNDNYAWVGADNAEVIILQDFRWGSELICWKDLLLPLEGEPVKLPSPKNQFATDVSIKTDIQMTDITKIECVGKHNMGDNREKKNDRCSVESIWISPQNPTTWAKKYYSLS